MCVQGGDVGIGGPKLSWTVGVSTQAKCFLNIISTERVNVGGGDTTSGFQLTNIRDKWTIFCFPGLSFQAVCRLWRSKLNEFTCNSCF